MLRQLPSRNQRSKGIKFKYFLQICLLLAVCFWLIYQIKHSHDKKKEFDENDAKNLLTTQSGNEVFKFGRKDLHPRVEERAKTIKEHDELVEEETGGEEEEEEENKHEEEEQEEDVEVDREEDFIEDEMEREEGDDKESEEKDVADKDDQLERESSLEDHARDGGASNTHDAREEQYKADDASSAVTHDTHNINTENENGILENSNENAEENTLSHENKVGNTEEIDVRQNTTGLKVEDGETAENGTSLNARVNEEKGSEIVPSESQGSSFLNSTTNNQPDLTTNLTEVSSEFHGLSFQNGTETTTDSTQAQNAMEGGTTIGEGSNLQTLVSDRNHFDSNSTISIATENAEANPEESSNSSANSEFTVSEKIVRSNASAEAEDSPGFSITDVNTDSTLNEKSDTSNGTDGTDESSGLPLTENTDEVQHDSSDSSIALEEKEVRTDLDTLPKIRSEGSNSEYAAAE